jgi:cold-inducible RNA-binding protein
MSNNLYVGNLAYAMTDEGLNRLFAEFGTVVSARVITDRMSGRSKGFGFVEMQTKDAADNAISQLNGKSIDGRNLIVDSARPPKKNF